MSDPDRRGWHVDKGIGVAHILTTGMIIVSVLWYLAGQDKRVAVLESGLTYVQQNQRNDQSRTEKKFDDIQVDLRNINTKLDRIIERKN